jgi:homopolymeric O-antigen transport system ATP-binding protein
MSSKPIISVSNLGKKYILKDSHAASLQNLKEQLTQWLVRNSAKTDQKEFWALQDLNFSISAGQTVGIIGSNGSGKSTLLKILARVTRPTTGCVEIHGRVSALLEVGTGFHFELSGRENIFLSGAMLGMKKSEVVKYFDEIVAFSEVEQFLDIPVKKYSSGMFLKLAFSVIAHLRSDILIIDEILAVGDSQFQVKCLKKMDAIVKEGRTILFVSHDLDKIKTLCQQVFWIKKGSLFRAGETDEVVALYKDHIPTDSSSLQS